MDRVPVSAGQPITRLLQRWKSGDAAAATELFPLVYEELRRLAWSYVRRERDLVICRTELVHELYLRLEDRPPEVENRSHFFAIAARLMRQILVDLARSQNRQKRRQAVTTISVRELDGESLTPHQEFADVLTVDQCLARLETLDARKCQIVELRYFGGLTIDEIATVLDISAPTVKRDLNIARLWLLRELDAPRG